MKITTRAKIGFLFTIATPMSGDLGDGIFPLGDAEVEIDIPEEILELMNNIEKVKGGMYYNMKPFFQNFVIDLPKDFELKIKTKES